MILFAACCMLAACYDDSELLNRIDALEKAMYQKQINALDASVKYLEKVDSEIKNTISTLQESIEESNEQIAELKSSVSSLGQTVSEIQAKILELEERIESNQSHIESLRQMDTELDGKISALKTLLETTNKETKEWVEASFATLEQYNSLVEDLGELNDLIASEISRVEKSVQEQYKALSAEISNTKSAMEEWVESTLENYASNEDFQNMASEFKSNLEAFEKRLKSFEEKINGLEAAMEELKAEFSISFSDMELCLLPGGKATVNYSIKGAKDGASVKPVCQNGWKAEVTQTTKDNGYIRVTAPDPMVEDEILVFVYDGEFKTIMKSLNFMTGKISSAISVIDAPQEGGLVTIDVTTNMNYEVVIPENAKSLLSLVETKAVRTDVLTFNCTENKSFRRSAIITLLDEEQDELMRFSINQRGGVVEITDLSSAGTANSYIVSNRGYYKFKTVKGNSDAPVGDIVSVELLWESFGTDKAPQKGDLIGELSYLDNYITFATSQTYKEGNAVIAAKDANGKILWSWHIWLTDRPENQVYNNNAGTMMDRNLGATSATPGDVGALGLLYQWGRKDPFLGSSSISAGNNIIAKSTLTWPEAVDSITDEGIVSGTIEYTIEHPTVFIKGNSDWLHAEDGSNDNTRWQSSKTIYDPCPVGYRVPDSGVWTTAFGTSDAFTEYSFDDINRGYNFGNEGSAKKLSDSVSICWYPAAGNFIHTAVLFDYVFFDYVSLNGVGDYGLYWSDMLGSVNSFYFYGNVRHVELCGRISRASGLSVRCLKEE